ncbi:hypothetical protein OQA88_958 [Cercophora sp. LCS_1]
MASPNSASAGQSDMPLQPLQLEMLPAELLSAVLEHLVPQRPEIGETRPVSYDKLVPGEAWYDFTRSRRALWSLCLVSRSFYAMARPLLYHTMAITDEECMFLLLRTLTDDPSHGQWTRFLSVHVTLTRESVVREMRRAVGRHLRSFRPAREPRVIMDLINRALDVMTVTLPAINTSAGDFDEVPQVIMAFILMFLVNLDTLLLQVPICDEHNDYTALFYKLRNVSGHFNKPDTDQSLAPLRKIHTLLLQGDPDLLNHFEHEDCNCEFPEVWGCQASQYHPLFEILPALTTLEVSTDDGSWSNLMIDDIGFFLSGGVPPAAYLKGIKHIYLHNSIACPQNLYHVLLNAPNLETMYMDPRKDDILERGPPDEGTEADEEALDVALTKYAKNLRRLDVAWFDAGGYETLIGPEGRLASLPELTKLEQLSIQLAVLYGTQPITVLETPLADLLPPNLVELTLDDWWWKSNHAFDRMPGWSAVQKVNHYRAQKEYRNMATQMLENFAVDSREKLPRLKKVMLLCRIPWTWMIEDAVEIDTHFVETKALFAARGVEFLVEEY